jgi:hypothetical protein
MLKGHRTRSCLDFALADLETEGPLEHTAEGILVTVGVQRRGQAPRSELDSEE